jgi:hypothetical protein
VPSEWGRIWGIRENGKQRDAFQVSSRCLALAFAESDDLLLVATKQNQLVVWSVRDGHLYSDQPLTWTADLNDSMQGRTPTSVTINTNLGLLAIIYLGEPVFLRDYVDEDESLIAGADLAGFGETELGKLRLM